MIERFALCIFFPCLFVCASMVLIGIWAGKGLLPPAYFQTAASLFVIGLTSFLVWFVRTLRRIIASLEA